jgi:DNA polymerase-3 subunit alpha
VAYSAAIHEQRASAQVSLFGEAGDDLPEPRLSPVEDWLPNERLAQEHTSIGFYLSGHPLDDFMPSLKRSGVMTLESITELVERAPAIAKIAGSVSGRQERKSAKGNRFAFVQLSDPTGLYEVTVFSDTLETAREHLEAGKNVVLTVEATMEAEQLKLLCRAATPIDSAIDRNASIGLRVFVDDQKAVPLIASLLGRMVEDPAIKSRGPVCLALQNPELPGEVEVTLGDKLPVNPQIKGALKSLAGVATVEDY